MGVNPMKWAESVQFYGWPILFLSQWSPVELSNSLPFHSGIYRKAHQGEASKNRSRISHLAITKTFRLPARFIRLLGTHPSCKVCAFALVPLHFPVPGPTRPGCCPGKGSSST